MQTYIVYIDRHMPVYMHTVYIHIYIYMYVSVSVYVCKIYLFNVMRM